MNCLSSAGSQFRMRPLNFLLFSIFLISSPSFAEESSSLSIVNSYKSTRCNDNLLNSKNSTGFEKILERLQILSPRLSQEFSKFPEADQNALSLFRLVKKELWNLSPSGRVLWTGRPSLSKGEVERLKIQYSKRYNLNESSEEEMFIFYVNSMTALLHALARELKEHFVFKNFDLSDSKKASLNFGVKVLDSIFFPQTLWSRDLSPEQVDSLLSRGLETREFWNAVWSVKALESDFKTLGYLELRASVNSCQTLEALNSEQKEIFIKIFSGSTCDPICCKTDPGCSLCPHNRRSLK